MTDKNEYRITKADFDRLMSEANNPKTDKKDDGITAGDVAGIAVGVGVVAASIFALPAILAAAGVTGALATAGVTLGGLYAAKEASGVAESVKRRVDK